MTRSLILASASPRRHDLLAALGLSFAVVPAAIDEVAVAGDREPAAGAIAVAAAKAGAVSGRHPGAVLLAADTIVVLDNAVLGKPIDPADARRMLAALRGRIHRVITATCVQEGERMTTRAVEAAVRMRAYTDSEIEAYVARGHGFDKAGAYGVQDEELRPVAAIDGCYCNVMGLPLWTAWRLLADAGCPAVRRPDEAFARCAACPLAGLAGEART